MRFLGQQVLLLLVILWLATSVVFAHTIILTDNLTKKKVRTSFNCRDKIYIYIKWNEFLRGKHVLEADWVNPTGKVRGHTLLRFSSSLQDSWLWFQLHGGTGVTLP